MQHTITRRHVSFNLTALIVLLIVLAMVAAATATYVGTQSVASNGNNFTAIGAAQPKDFAALKDAQLEKTDAARIGGTSIPSTAESDNYQALQKEQRDAMNSATSVAAVPIRPKDYAALKDVQLDQLDAPRGTLGSGWVYHYDLLKGKWIAQHYTATPSGPALDKSVELDSAP